jgi:ABC-type nitrate/sulfonate/bicarbonate transport system permease component
VAVACALALWEVAVRSGALSDTSFPPMTETVAELGRQLGTGAFWTALLNTLQGWALGLGLAILLAVPAGILVGSSRLAYRALRVPIEFLRPIPSVALIPLAVLVYGTGLESKVFLAVFASFWPLFVQTMYGVQDVDPVLSDTARSFGLGRFERIWRIRLPAAVPYIATGVRISSAVALILAVTAELVIGSAGLGRSISVAQSGGAIDVMYALIIATGMLGWLLNILASSGERRVLHWHPSQRELPACGATWRSRWRSPSRSRCSCCGASSRRRATPSTSRRSRTSCRSSRSCGCSTASDPMCSRACSGCSSAT